MNMKGNILLTLLVSFFTLTACNGQTGEPETEVMLETNLGNIRIKLYNDTPRHRDNFIKNVKEGKYDDCVWNRIIRNFMIQTGEQDSGLKDRASVDTSVVDTSAWISPEILFPRHYHKRGAVAAAREGDDVNPNWKSDQYQFYIVTGRTYTEDGLRELELANEEKVAQRIYAGKIEKHKDELDDMRRRRDLQGVSDMLENLLDESREEVAGNPPVKYSSEQIRSYRSIGGAPWLDREYTVFGEVVEGMKTVHAIEKVKTDENDRPLGEVKIIKAYVIE